MVVGSQPMVEPGVVRPEMLDEPEVQPAGEKLHSSIFSDVITIPNFFADALVIRSLCAAIGATTIDPKLQTAECLQYEGFLHREDVNSAILALYRDGVPNKG